MYTQSVISGNGEVVGVEGGGLLTTVYLMGGRLEKERARAVPNQV